MNPYDSIREQLEEQGIRYEILQDGYSPVDSPLSKVIKAWEQKFIGTKSVPALKNYLWHIFSYKATECFDGKEAEEELEKLSPTDTLIFNEPQQYLIKCIGKIPKISMDDFFDDIYISSQNMEWTYVIPHEVHNGIGPYFSFGEK